MKKIYALLVLFSLASVVPVTAREALYKGEIKCIPRVERVGDLVSIAVDVDLSDIRLGSQQMIVLTPALRSAAGAYIYRGAPVVVTGRTRTKALDRALHFGTAEFDPAPAQTLRRKNGTAQMVSIPMSVGYGDWMHETSLVLVEEISACVACGHTVRERELLRPLLPAPEVFVPEYRISYITPPTEEVQVRSDSYVCRVNYVVDKWDLLRDFRGNAAILDEVDAVIREIQNDPDLTITECSVIGYASPEGRYDRNLLLADNRARAFMNYLRDRHGWDLSIVRSEGRGEDWDGLRAAVVAAPSVPDRDMVLEVIDNTPDIALRKRKLQALSGGSTYRWLLAELYPPLRRNEYRVSYVARAFDIEEAKKLVRTRPGLLSLNEMFLVANTYPKDSEEFKYVFDVAARLFPTDAVANLNAGAAEVETGAHDAAIRRLERLQTPEAWNNLGVARAATGDAVGAEADFRRAAAAGSADAVHNLQQLLQAKEN
jgi:hypothetical protein